MLAGVSPRLKVISILRRGLGFDSESSTYIFMTPRVGYRMRKAEGRR